MEKFHFPRKRNKQMLRFANFALIFLTCACGCSVFETVETKDYAMTWKIKRDQTNKGHHLVEFEFVDFPGHVIGYYSNDLIEHLNERGKEEVLVVLEITRNILGDVSYSEVEIEGLRQWSSSFSYGGTSGDPPNSPFE